MLQAKIKIIMEGKVHQVNKKEVTVYGRQYITFPAVYAILGRRPHLHHMKKFGVSVEEAGVELPKTGKRTCTYVIHLSKVPDMLKHFDMSKDKIEACMKALQEEEEEEESVPIRKRTRQDSSVEEIVIPLASADLKAEIFSELVKNHEDEVKQLVLKKLANKSLSELMSFI